jgi:hypothetical protein
MSVASLLGEIRALKLDLARLDPRAGMPVLPPPGATPAGLLGAERKLGRALPSAYRELLAIHDGFPQLYQGASLLSTSQLVRGSFVDIARMTIDLDGEPRSSDSRLRRPTLVPFGIDSGAETIFAFDREAPGPELGVLIWVNEIGVRLDGFDAFLDFITEMLQADVEERRRDVEPRSQRLVAAPWSLGAGHVVERSAPLARSAPLVFAA